MGWAVGVGVVLGLTVLGLGVRSIVSGQRDGRAEDASPEDRMVASLRVAAGVRLLTKGVLVLVLAGIAAYVVR